MTTDQNQTAAVTPGVGVSRMGDPFFFWFGLFLLLITVVGFSRTYFLASVFEAPALPLYLKIHGATGVAWVLLYVLQASLIETSRVRTHMWIGSAAAVLAVGVVVSGLVVLHGVIRGSEDLAADLPRVGSTVWGNLTVLTAFLSFVGLGLYSRRRPQVHKRFMLLATLSMMGQPLVRIGQIPAIRISEVRVENDAIYGLGGLAVLVGVTIAYDLWKRRKPHPVFAVGGPGFLAALTIVGLFVANSPAGRAVVLWLG